MGSLSWSALDGRPGYKEGHDSDWNTNVMVYTTPGNGEANYGKFQSEVSRFPKNFTIKNMLVDYYDIKRGKKLWNLLEK